MARAAKTSPVKKKKKGSLKTDQSPEQDRDVQQGNTSCSVAAPLNGAFDSHLYNGWSAVSEWLIRAITGMCWVKVATVAPGKWGRAAAILTLLSVLFVKKGWGWLPEPSTSSPPTEDAESVLLFSTRRWCSADLSMKKREERFTFKEAPFALLLHDVPGQRAKTVS